MMELGWVVVWDQLGDRSYLQAGSIGTLPEWGSPLFAKRFTTEPDAERAARVIRETYPFDGDITIEREEEIRDQI